MISFVLSTYQIDDSFFSSFFSSLWVGTKTLYASFSIHHWTLELDSSESWSAAWISSSSGFKFICFKMSQISIVFFYFFVKNFVMETIDSLNLRISSLSINTYFLTLWNHSISDLYSPKSYLYFEPEIDSFKDSSNGGTINFSIMTF